MLFATVSCDRLPLSYVCRAWGVCALGGGRKRLIYLASGAADLWRVNVLKGASQLRPHCDFRKQKGLPLHDRQRRAPSLKDIKKEKKETYVRHWLCVVAHFSCQLLSICGVKSEWTVCFWTPSHCLGGTFQSKGRSRWMKLSGRERKKRARRHVAGACWLVMDKIQMRQFGLRGGRVRNVDFRKKKKKGIRVQDKRPLAVCGLRWVLIAAPTRPSWADRGIKCPPIRSSSTKTGKDPPRGLTHSCTCTTTYYKTWDEGTQPGSHTESRK